MAYSKWRYLRRRYERRVTKAIVYAMLRFPRLREYIWYETEAARAEGWTAGLKHGVIGAREAAEGKAARRA